MKPTNFKFVFCTLRISAHIIGSVYTNGFLKVWLGIPASNRNWGSQSPFCYHYNNPQYTNRFIHPTYGNRYGLWGFRRQSWISTSAYTANAERETSSSCTISLISDVTLPTRLGLRPIALLLPFFTSAILHLLSVLLSHFQPNTDTGHLVLFEDCGSILLAVGWLDYIVITSYVSQLVNHLRTRTPMGDLVE